MTKPLTVQPNAVDVHVGSRIRRRRKMIGVSQSKLAADLGLTFQQVQKYERGFNRVSASKLYEVARSLQVPVSFFFDGLHDPAAAPAGEPDGTALPAINAFLATPEGHELALALPRLKRGRARRRVLDLVRAIAEEDTVAD